MLHLVIDITTPLLLAGLGGLVTELAGSLNIGLEGLILAGAFGAILGTSATGSYFVGVCIAVLTGIALSLVFVAFGHRLRANMFITGLAINLLAVGLTAVLSSAFFATQGVIPSGARRPLRLYHIPLIDQIPVIGPVLSGHSLFVPTAWLLLILTALVVNRSRFGLELRATGIMSEAVRVRGGNPDAYRAIAIVFSGVTCGLAGAALSLELGAFVPNMSAGRGWIALVMVFLGRRRPWGVAVAGIFFATTEYTANAIQGTIGLPKTLALAVPYVLTLLSMVVFAIVQRRAAQSATKPR